MYAMWIKKGVLFIYEQTEKCGHGSKSTSDGRSLAILENFTPLASSQAPLGGSDDPMTAASAPPTFRTPPWLDCWLSGPTFSASGRWLVGYHSNPAAVIGSFLQAVRDRLSALGFQITRCSPSLYGDSLPYPHFWGRSQIVRLSIPVTYFIVNPKWKMTVFHPSSFLWFTKWCCGSAPCSSFLFFLKVFLSPILFPLESEVASSY